MHRQVAADAVPGAMIEIEAVAPEKLPRQGIKLRAGCTIGKERARNRDMAFQHECEVLPHIGARRADRERARDVSGAVFVLATGIDEKQLAGRDAAVAAAADTIMHNG